MRHLRTESVGSRPEEAIDMAGPTVSSDFAILRSCARYSSTGQDYGRITFKIICAVFGLSLDKN